jgi:hypothetical protein
LENPNDGTERNHLEKMAQKAITWKIQMLAQKEIPWNLRGQRTFAGLDVDDS